MLLSPQYTDTYWNALDLLTEDSWQRAIDVVEDRIRGRWLNWADVLIKSRYSGLVVLTIDCIVLESLWGFMNGKSVPSGTEKKVYADILTGEGFGLTIEQSESFRRFVRNGLMHDAETRGRWRVQSSTPSHGIIEQRENGDSLINRSRFHQAIKASVNDWLKSLRQGDTKLRDNLRTRVNEIIAVHYH